MSELMNIQDFIQSYVQAVSSILHSEVTIVDRDLRRVGGTGEYQNQIGQHVPHASLFRNIMESGCPGIVRDPNEEQLCIQCDKRDSCREMASIAFPIRKGNNVVGVISVVAFDQNQRVRILEEHDKLEEFLKYMSALIESKLISMQVNQTLTQQIREVTSWQNEANGFNRIIGATPRFLEAIDLARKVSTSDSTVMLRGESGTGKELFAKAIHGQSNRADRLLITVNCAAIPESLVESELFGYEEGAFTGAKKSGHVGKFELADKSTIFLDEVGDMSLPAQTKLLRVLQEQKIERIGGKAPIGIDVRVLCATNRNLEEMVEKGTFREDLYYRLNVIPVFIPPLRERREDIPSLLQHYINYYNVRVGKQISCASSEVIGILTDYAWPGNIRELKNIVEYIVNVAEQEVLTVADLPDHLLLKGKPTQKSLEHLLEEYEKKIILAMMRGKTTLEQKREVASMLSISPATLYRKIKKYQNS